MVLLGYSGEGLVDADQLQERWIYWSLAMFPFLFILYNLIIKLKNPISKQPKNVQSLVSNARWLLIGSWTIYPIVYLLPIFDPSASYVNLTGWLYGCRYLINRLIWYYDLFNRSKKIGYWSIKANLKNNQL